MARFIKLTVIGSGVEYLNMGMATSIRPVAKGTWAEGQGARSVVNILGSQGGINYDVVEAPEQILALINDLRGAA